MSEKFGLDWQKYDSKRVAYLLEIFATLNKRDKIESDKLKMKNNGRNR